MSFRRTEYIAPILATVLVVLGIAWLISTAMRRASARPAPPQPERLKLQLPKRDPR